MLAPTVEILSTFLAIMSLHSARFVLATTLAAVSLSCAASPDCPKLKYPHEALKRGEAGISLVAFLVRPDGTVTRSVVLSSSGSDELDRETKVGLSRCKFQPPSAPIDPEGYWSPIAYTWLIDDDPDMARQKREAALAAREGDVDALFRLSLLLSGRAKNDVDRQRALAVLSNAAAKGNAAAQYELGKRYEKGDGVEKSPDEAMQWYERAAKQEYILAVQRLRLGVLTD
jgi:TonB family protein